MLIGSWLWSCSYPSCAGRKKLHGHIEILNILQNSSNYFMKFLNYLQKTKKFHKNSKKISHVFPMGKTKNILQKTKKFCEILKIFCKIRKNFVKIQKYFVKIQKYFVKFKNNSRNSKNYFQKPE